MVDFVVYEGAYDTDTLYDGATELAAIPTGLNTSIGEDDGSEALSSLARVIDGCDVGDPSREWQVGAPTPGAPITP